MAQRAPKSRQTLQRLLAAAPGKIKLLDLNLRKTCFSRETITESLQAATMLKLNEAEAGHLAGLLAGASGSLPDFCERILAAYSLSVCLVTLGERGVFAATTDGQKVHVPGYQVKLADSCGSGDTFTAGFIHAFLRQNPLVECCRLGNTLGAMVATQTGATPPISPSEVQAFRAADHPRMMETRLENFAVD